VSTVTILSSDGAGHAWPAHPERPARVDALRRGLERAAVGMLVREGAPAAPREALERVHPPRYLDALEAVATAPRLLDGDTYVTAESVEAARRAAGGAIRAVEEVLAGERAWSLCRPPGHHATATQPMGFCLYSNVAVAVRHAQAVHGVERVAVVDWDVHHGNGTQAIFYADPSVLTVSLHQAHLFPWSGEAHETGTGEGRGACVNVPLPAGTAPEAYLTRFDAEALPAVEAFAPELVVVSCGFDAHADDPLAELDLDAATFAELTRRVRALCARLGIAEPALVLEGGYDLGALADCAQSVIEAYWVTSRG
jgi:acetoin utilization deacetylase AcuC-like enzyme